MVRGAEQPPRHGLFLQAVEIRPGSLVAHPELCQHGHVTAVLVLCSASIPIFSLMMHRYEYQVFWLTSNPSSQKYCVMSEGVR